MTDAPDGSAAPPSEPRDRGPVVTALDWTFRSRVTGRITIAQFPNVSFAIFLIASAVRRLADPTGAAGTVVTVVATGALLWWAVDEVVRGVNPWRRFLGVVVLLATLLGLATR